MAFGIKWLKPELDEPKYWVHILILAVIVITIQPMISNIISQWLTGMFANILSYGLAIAAADMVAHTVLQMD